MQVSVMGQFINWSQVIHVEDVCRFSSLSMQCFKPFSRNTALGIFQKNCFFGLVADILGC